MRKVVLMWHIWVRAGQMDHMQQPRGYLRDDNGSVAGKAATTAHMIKILKRSTGAQTKAAK